MPEDGLRLGVKLSVSRHATWRWPRVAAGRLGCARIAQQDLLLLLEDSLGAVSTPDPEPLPRLRTQATLRRRNEASRRHSLYGHDPARYDRSFHHPRLQRRARHEPEGRRRERADLDDNRDGAVAERRTDVHDSITVLERSHANCVGGCSSAVGHERLLLAAWIHRVRRERATRRRWRYRAAPLVDSAERVLRSPFREAPLGARDSFRTEWRAIRCFAGSLLCRRRGCGPGGGRHDPR